MTTQITESKKVIGYTDSVNECDCCGKSELKGTFCVSINGTEFYYGSTCAFKKHGFDKKIVETSVRKFKRDQYLSQLNAKSEKQRAYMETQVWEWA